MYWYCKGQRCWLHLLIKLEIAMYNILVADNYDLNWSILLGLQETLLVSTVNNWVLAELKYSC